MPGYTFVGGSLANGYLQFLMDKPDGSRVFVGCTYEGEIRLYESTPLPAQTYYGVENFTNSLGMNGQGVTLSFYPDLSQWGVSQILEAGIPAGAALRVQRLGPADDVLWRPSVEQHCVD